VLTSSVGLLAIKGERTRQMKVRRQKERDMKIERELKRALRLQEKKRGNNE
jgi:hypothetical protein